MKNYVVKKRESDGTVEIGAVSAVSVDEARIIVGRTHHMNGTSNGPFPYVFVDGETHPFPWGSWSIG